MKTLALFQDQLAKHIERFWTKVDKRRPDECWPWTAYINKFGYGAFRVDGRVIHAQRFAFATSRGGVPAGQLVCHTCDNRACCNPDHLWLGTIDDNMRDRNDKGRMARGNRAACRRLTEDDVRKIAADKRTTTEIAAAYNVHFTTIYDVQRGRNWAWLTGIGL